MCLSQVPQRDAAVLLRSQIHRIHQLLDEHVVAAVERTKAAPALQREILSLYAHSLCVEDATVNLLLRGTPPSFTSTWIGGRLAPWDLTSIQGYADVVYAGTDVMLEQLTSANLQTPVDLSDVGLGRPDVVWVLNTFILWPTVMTCGEIASKHRQYVRADTNPSALAQTEAAPRSDRSNGSHSASPGSSNGSTNGVAHADTGRRGKRRILADSVTGE
jgi:hypothetical protein